MKHVIVLPVALAAVLVSAPMNAAEPPVEQFAVRIDVAAPSGATFVRVRIPADVFRHTQSPDLADLRVFNAAGERLPFALTRPQPEKPAEDATAVAVYPIRETEHRAALAGSRMEIRQQGGITAVLVDGKLAAPAATSRVAAYLIDVREIKQAAVALELDADFDAARLVPVTVEASRDLKTWSTLARGEPVFRLSGSDAAAQSRTLQLRTRVGFASATPLEGRYLRLTWSESATFTVKAATLKTVAADGGTRIPDAEIALGAPASREADALEWALPTKASVARVSLALAQSNALVPVTVFARRRVGEPWAAVGRGVVYRLREGEVESTSTPFDITPGAYQALRVLPDRGSAGFGAVPPTLSLHFAPRDVVFLARGQSPRESFVLAAGHAQARSVALPLPTLMPGYVPNAERALPLAQTANVQIDPARASPAGGLFGIELRTLALWAVLIIAVLILSLFAFSLIRKVNASAPPPADSSPSP